MINREKINAMTNKGLGQELCSIVESTVTAISEKKGLDCASDYCEFCPVNDLCEMGYNGFRKYFEMDSEDRASWEEK